MIDTLHSQFSHLIPHAILAIFGAFVHALIAYRNGSTKTLLDFGALTVISSFTGIIFLLLGSNYFPDQPYLVSALAGSGGYLGVEGMSYVVSVIKNKSIIKIKFR